MLLCSLSPLLLDEVLESLASDSAESSAPEIVAHRSAMCSSMRSSKSSMVMFCLGDRGVSCIGSHAVVPRGRVVRGLQVIGPCEYTDGEYSGTSTACSTVPSSHCSITLVHVSSDRWDQVRFCWQQSILRMRIQSQGSIGEVGIGVSSIAMTVSARLSPTI